MRDYVEVGQYSVGKIEKNISDVNGILTSNLKVCLGIVATNGIRSMLLHVDSNVDTDFIVEQLEWFDNIDYTLHIGCDQRQLERVGLGQSFSVSGFIERLKTSMQRANKQYWQTINTHRIAREYFGVTIDGKIITQSKICEKPPKAQVRSAINFLNYLTSSDPTKEFAQMKLDLAYNINDWTEMPKLSVTASYAYNCYRKASNWNSFLLKLSDDKKIPDFIIILFNSAKDSLGIVHYYYEDIVNECAVQLDYDTKCLLGNSMPLAWKKYPDKKLTGKYIGCRVQFFTMPTNEKTTAVTLEQSLKEKGYDVKLASANTKPSLVVNLTTSCLDPSRKLQNS